MSDQLTVGVVIYPGVTALDFVGPTQVLSEAMGFSTVMLWKDTSPVQTDAGFAVVPTASFAESPPLDMILLPGGSGQQGVMEDTELIDFVRERGEQAQYVCSVCSGSLLLAKAGLLNGYRATSHWAYVDDLAKFGAEPVRERVVVDRNRITGGGVSAGIDFAFSVLALIRGEESAKLMQLALEYDPEPPFDWGDPDRADPAAVEQLRTVFRAMITT